MVYYDEKLQMKKWERLSHLRMQMLSMENTWEEPEEEGTTVLADMLSGETININAIHTGVPWQKANEVNQGISRLVGMDAYRGTLE
ncbi:hypothetical protein JQN58_18865 [Aneurinibacillus sp. BA2021]|nr:hypothetical protein [Aneurinibacillus sp. BA2021]